MSKELREALADYLHEWTAVTYSDVERLEIADALLSGPLAPLLAAQAAATGVREGIDVLLRSRDILSEDDLWWSLGKLRAALDGAP